jgi:hypothetical protein
MREDEGGGWEEDGRRMGGGWEEDGRRGGTKYLKHNWRKVVTPFVKLLKGFTGGIIVFGIFTKIKYFTFYKIFTHVYDVK